MICVVMTQNSVIQCFNLNVFRNWSWHLEYIWMMKQRFQSKYKQPPVHIHKWVYFGAMRFILEFNSYDSAQTSCNQRESEKEKSILKISKSNLYHKPPLPSVF